MDRSELDTDKVIDPEQLDVEVTRQADVFFKWAERLVHAANALEVAEFKMEVLEAHLQMECREEPEKFGISGNATETAVKSAVKCHSTYTAAMHDFFQIKQEKMWLEKAVMAMDMKKRMLESLIELHGQQYFAGPASPRDLVAIWKQRPENSPRQQTVARKRVKTESN